MKEHHIGDFEGACEALRHPDLAQALYDDGRLVMADALVNLHGRAHAERRAAEFSVFTRAFFREYESKVFPRTLAPVLAPYLEAGRADLVELGYRVTMNLTADFAGIDRLEGSVQETETLLELVRTFSIGATLVHSTRDPAAVEARVQEALDCFRGQFLERSIARRERLLDAGAPLPNDVLSTLLARRQQLPLSADVLRREMAFYLQAGAHSTANATTHAVHEILTWCGDAEDRRRSLAADDRGLQRAVHESLRLHPASPVAWRKAMVDLRVADLEIPAGDRLVIDLAAANRDRSVFGDDADQFDPGRRLPEGVWPFGLTFGYGAHACLGRDLDGGVVAKTNDRPGAGRQLGIVTLLVGTLLAHGARSVPGVPPVKDAGTRRDHWGSYPVLLGACP